MNWGGFAGGLSQGINDGMRLSRFLKEAQAENEMAEIRSKGADEASAARQADAAAMIRENGLSGARTDASVRDANDPAPQSRPAESTDPTTPDPVAQAALMPPQPAADNPPVAQTYSLTPASAGLNAPTPLPESAVIAPPSQGAAPPVSGIPSAADKAQEPQPITPAQTASKIGLPAQPEPQMPFIVGNKGFNTREEAAKHADTLVAPMSEYLMKTVVPKYQEHFIAKGDVASAEKLGQYMDSKRGRDAVKSFGTAMTKLMYTNDVNGGVQALGGYYNKFIDDGVDFTKGEIGQDGKINITVKRRDGGGENVMSLNKNELVRMGFAHDPAQLFKMGLAQVETQEATAAQLAKENRVEARDIRKEGRTETRDIAKDKRAHNAKIEEKTLDAELDSAKPGETGKKIRDLRKFGWDDGQINDLLKKSGDFKKVTDPTERRAIVTSELVKSDPSFGRKTREKQSEQVNQMMAVIYGDEKPAAKNPAAGGLPAAPAPASKGKVPVFDTKTGTIVYK